MQVELQVAAGPNIRDNGRESLVSPASTGPPLSPDCPSERVNVVMLSGCPYMTTGGGQQPAKVAKWLGKIGHRVLYLECRKPGGPRVTGIPNVTVLPADDIDLAVAENFYGMANAVQRIPNEVGLHFRRRVERWRTTRGLIVLLSAPTPMFAYLSEYLRFPNVKIGFIALDDWADLAPTMGAQWYDPAVENYILKRANFVCATAKPIAQKIEKRFPNKRVDLIENGFDSEAFSGLKSPISPSDWIKGSLTFVYWGHLRGPWMMWDMLLEVSRQRPKWKFNFIGEFSKPKSGDRFWEKMYPKLVAHVRQTGRFSFTGPKYNEELKNYARADYALIPFANDRLVASVNPIKGWEYLASGMKILASGVSEVENWPNTTYLDTPTAQSFIKAAERNRKARWKKKETKAFLRRASWEERAEDYSQVFSSLGVDSGPWLRQSV